MRTNHILGLTARNHSNHSHPGAWLASQLELGGEGLPFFKGFGTVSDYAHPNRAHAGFHKGVLFTNNLPKGPILVDFVKRHQVQSVLNPSGPSQSLHHVVFVDDRLDNCKSVHKSLKHAGENITESITFHYTGAVQ